MASIKIAYAASSALDVTNLASMATSATWIGGWESPTVDNTSNLYVDYLVSGKLALGNSATAGEIRIYAVAMIDDSEWPDVIDGTQSTETWSDATLRDASAVLLKAFATRADPGTDDVYPFGPVSVAAAFGGVCPAKFALFISHSTGVNLAASGHEVHVKGAYYTSA
jgi:hypothetical protein